MSAVGCVVGVVLVLTLPLVFGVCGLLLMFGVCVVLAADVVVGVVLRVHRWFSVGVYGYFGVNAMFTCLLVLTSTVVTVCCF